MKEAGSNILAGYGCPVIGLPWKILVLLPLSFAFPEFFLLILSRLLCPGG